MGGAGVQQLNWWIRRFALRIILRLTSDRIEVAGGGMTAAAVRPSRFENLESTRRTLSPLLSRTQPRIPATGGRCRRSVASRQAGSPRASSPRRGADAVGRERRRHETERFSWCRATRPRRLACAPEGPPRSRPDSSDHSTCCSSAGCSSCSDQDRMAWLFGPAALTGMRTGRTPSALKMRSGAARAILRSTELANPHAVPIRIR